MWTWVLAAFGLPEDSISCGFEWKKAWGAAFGHLTCKGTWFRVGVGKGGTLTLSVLT